MSAPASGKEGGPGLNTASRWRAADEVVCLQRGDEHILFNARHANPAYFARGGREVLSALEALRRGGPMETPPPELCPPELFEFLRAHALLVPAEEAPAASCPGCAHSNCAGSAPSQRSLYLLLSQSCNQACIYCYNGRETYHSEQPVMMTPEIAFQAVERNLAGLAPNGRLEIAFFGGEPLLNWRLARAIVDHCERSLKPAYPDKEIRYGMTTNLTFLPHDLIPLAREHRISFLVGVDGPPDVHDRTRAFRRGRPSLATTVANVRRLLEAGLQVSLRATVTAFNHERMLEVSTLHKEIGGEGSAFVPLNAVDSDGRVFPPEWCASPDVFAAGLREVFHARLWPVERLYPFNEMAGRLVPGYRNTHACGAPYGNTPVVATNGKIFSCIYLVNQPQFEIGDVRGGEYPKAEVVKRMLDAVDIDRRPRCQGCGFRYLCGGGCPVGLFSIAANPNASAFVRDYTERMACAMAKPVFEELMWDLSRQTGIAPALA